jgi:glycosyltransferase involved in cell wall biosynthesis
MTRIKIKDIELAGRAGPRISLGEFKNPPLVSCIMPTHNRRLFIQKAIEYFRRQDYPKRELVIADDGEESIRDLVPQESGIQYIGHNNKSALGAKRNLACEEANGKIILHWDDDDWMAPWRISYQVKTLLKEHADICGLNKMIFYNPKNRQSWFYLYPERGRPWVCGGTLCYTKRYWERHPFPEIDVGEDNSFLWDSGLKRIAILQDPTFYIAIIHPGNASSKLTTDFLWHSYPAVKVRALLGQDCAFYDHLKL